MGITWEGGRWNKGASLPGFWWGRVRWWPPFWGPWQLALGSASPKIGSALPLLPLCCVATASLRWNPEELGSWYVALGLHSTDVALVHICFLFFFIFWPWLGFLLVLGFFDWFVGLGFFLFKFNLGVFLFLLLMKTPSCSMFCIGNKNLLVFLLPSFLNYWRYKLLIIELPVFFHHIAPLKGLYNINRCFT